MAELEAQTNPDARKNFVGNAIYPFIQQRFGDLTGKITGMLIDEKLVNFTQLLTDPQYFTNKCYEAEQLLKISMQQ